MKKESEKETERERYATKLHFLNIFLFYLLIDSIHLKVFSKNIYSHSLGSI